MEPTAAARAYYRALDDGDYDRLVELLAPDFRQERPDMTLEGRDRFVGFVREERPQTETSHPIDAVWADGDEVAVEGRLLDADGERITGFVDVFELSDGEIRRLKTYTD